MSNNLQYSHFLGEKPNYTDSKFVIIPAPLEDTVSYGKGTKFAPYKILEASVQLETYDIETKKELVKEGIYTIAPINFKNDTESFMNELSLAVSKVLKDKKFPVILGGEHSITPAVVSSFKNFYKNISILHFDAHLDLRKTYEGTKYSHACPMRRLIDEYDIQNIVSLGIRSVAPKEIDFLRSTDKIKVFYAEDILAKSFDISNVVNNLTENVFISFDVDVFDPAVMPSTGTPEPGGLFWYDIIKILRSVSRYKKIIGFDVVELAPDSVNHHSDFTVAKLIYKILNYI